MDELLKEKISKLPQKSGVYFFKDFAERVLYVGKAQNLKKRVKNHFAKPDQHFWNFIKDVADIDFIKTRSEKEAIILEAQLIKKLQPRFNIEWKDDKNYFFIAVTREDFPRVYLTHQPGFKFAGELSRRYSRGSNPPELFQRVRPSSYKAASFYGPFVSGREVKTFLREIRKILPFRSCKNLGKKPCLYESLHLCPAPCVHKRKKIYYKKIVETLTALIQLYLDSDIRVEGYDISNLSGMLAVGSMVVFQNGRKKPSDYRKFKIKRVKGQNDVKSLKEVLLRRQKHPEWPIPHLVLLDGGKGQLKAARGQKTPSLALAKLKRSEGKLFSPFSKNFTLLSALPESVRNLLLQVRDESHRFAITYNKKRRESFLD